jgi:hypothetical protein
MPVHYSFTLADGTEQDPAQELTPVQQAFLILNEMRMGVPVLNRSTLDEFVRRADLVQTYIGVVWRNGDGTPRIFTRADFVELLPGARTNWPKVAKATFDQVMKKEIAAYWASVDSRK